MPIYFTQNGVKSTSFIILYHNVLKYIIYNKLRCYSVQLDIIKEELE